ncbi:MAG: hypothetical protein PVI01_10790 [Gemmatimonadales bacterium]
MNYLDFLLHWYNWPYLAGFAFGLLSFSGVRGLAALGRAMGRRLGVDRVSPFVLIRAFGFALGVIGLTYNGALHDYWPTLQEKAFLPGLIISAVLAGLVTRWVGRIFERNFPEIKAVGWGSPHLEGREARVVSRVVSPDYRAGRAQLMGEDKTLHVVLCKTREGEIPYGAEIVLSEYDDADGRYYVAERGEALRSDEAEEHEASGR